MRVNWSVSRSHACELERVPLIWKGEQSRLPQPMTWHQPRATLPTLQRIAVDRNPPQPRA